MQLLTISKVAIMSSKRLKNPLNFIAYQGMLNSKSYILVSFDVIFLFMKVSETIDIIKSKLRGALPLSD